jgi:hypothetical protein
MAQVCLSLNMAVVRGVPQEQHAVVGFLMCENETVGNIYVGRCMGRILLLAAQRVAGHKEHQANVDMQTFAICRAVAGHALCGRTSVLRG